MSVTATAAGAPVRNAVRRAMRFTRGMEPCYVGVGWLDDEEPTRPRRGCGVAPAAGVRTVKRSTRRRVLDCAYI
jgi:hypothetical protein